MSERRFAARAAPINAAETEFNRHVPRQFPEGSPAHPADGSGHATVAGARVTLRLGEEVAVGLLREVTLTSLTRDPHRSTSINIYR